MFSLVFEGFGWYSKQILHTEGVRDNYASKHDCPQLDCPQLDSA